MISFEHVTKTLGGRNVLRDLSFTIEKGETFVIVGPSGVGKSVTLKHMVRLMMPDEGRVLFDGRDTAEADARGMEAIRERFGYLFQGGALLEWLTVRENVALPLRERTRMGGVEIGERVGRMLELVGLEKDGEKRPSEISGGMRKRAGLARAMIREPEIILYDEPTSGLDPVSSRNIDSLIRDLRARMKVTGVVVTHDLHSALSIGTRIAMLHGGRFVEVADPAGFISSGEDEVRKFLDSQFITKKGSWEAR
jgi:phospholipid/cholesterol/gamma-HCH transport system ATP-binding protein